MKADLWKTFGLFLFLQAISSTTTEAEETEKDDGEEVVEAPEKDETEIENLPSVNMDEIMPEKLIRPDGLKILFLTKDMEDLFFSGATERLNQYTLELGTSLKRFQESVTDKLSLRRHIRSINNFTKSISQEEMELLHVVVKRRARQYVVRCCGYNSCSYSSRMNQRRDGYNNGYGFGNGYGYGNNGYGGYSPWNGYQTNSNVNRGSNNFNAKAVANVLPHGVSISCPGCSPGWQQNLNFGHGVGWIPISCPRCPKGWQQMLNMGPAAPNVDYDEETTTTSTTTSTTTTTTTPTTESTTESTTEAPTTVEETTVEVTTAAAAGGLGALGGLGGLAGLLG